MPSSLRVEGFHFDDENEEKLWSHGLTPIQVLQVLEHSHRIKKNRGQRRGAYLIIGRDRQGQCLAIPIEPTHDRRLWRPITGWYCKASEWSQLP